MKLIAEETPKLATMHRLSMIYALKYIVMKYKDVVNKYRPMIEEQKKEFQLREQCQAIIDMLEDRTLE